MLFLAVGRVWLKKEVSCLRTERTGEWYNNHQYLFEKGKKIKTKGKQLSLSINDVVGLKRFVLFSPFNLIY